MATDAPLSSPYTQFEIRKRLPDPKTAALLVIDMQNHFASIANPIIPATTTTIDLCQRAGIPVIFTRHRHTPDDDGGALGEWWGGDLILDGTRDSELLPEMVAAAGTRRRESGDDGEMIVVEKNTYSAFRNTRLEERLGELGVKEVIVTGVMTNLCCETTARDAFVRGFRVFFSTDATATSARELHEATLKNMAYGFAYLVDCQRLKNAFFD